MTFREFTGKNVEEAIRAAMAEFSADLGDLDIEILSQGSRGILGVGGEEARILAAPKSAVDAAETVREPVAVRDEAPEKPAGRGRGRRRADETPPEDAAEGAPADVDEAPPADTPARTRQRRRPAPGRAERASVAAAVDEVAADEGGTAASVTTGARASRAVSASLASREPIARPASPRRSFRASRSTSCRRRSARRSRRRRPCSRRCCPSWA
jgi:spoIIIJ-associated protein